MIDTACSNALPHRVRGFYPLNPSQRYQTLEGWGSSLCWWAAQVGNWDEKKVDEVVDLITSPDKLNMNIFRYNIGGGDDPSHADEIIRFFRQGYTSIDTGNAHALAALSPSGKELVVAVLNITQSDRPFTLDLNKFANKVTQIDGWRTSKTEDCQALANIRHNKKQITYNSPAGSLTTFVIK